MAHAYNARRVSARCLRGIVGVGPARFGLATSRLSAGRSNQAKLRARGRAEGMSRLKRSLLLARIGSHLC